MSEETSACCSSSCCSTGNTQVQLSEWVTGTVDTSVGPIYKVSTKWTRTDHWGQIRARTTSSRMDYTVEPGLYAVGEPDEQADVFVSANYKLSFDILRRALQGINGWILVLDTKGINVWCAAGKGTFGTYELVNRILDAQLEKVVSHKRIIVPQLGAPGINAGEVQKRTTFRVLYGPVDAQDIPAYIQDDYTALPGMRSVKFNVMDRVILTPMELNPALKRYPLYALIVLALFGLQPSGILFRDAWSGALPFLVLGLISIIAGAFLTPALLPFVPSRSFAIKGWLVGVVVIFISQYFEICRIVSPVLLVMTFLLFPLLSSYLALQFTGATTFTNISGVKKELKFGVPVYIAGGIGSLLLLLFYKFSQWG